MAADPHHVIIGNGVAGNRAAALLRERDPDNRITIISIGGLLFYDRYQLTQVFQGKRDWRDYLVYQPEYYEDHRITVRRKCRVTQVDPTRRVLILAHREEVGYDQLLIASGGGGYVAFYCPTNKQHEVRAVLEKMGGSFSDFAFDDQGMQVWRSASR